GRSSGAVDEERPAAHGDASAGESDNGLHEILPRIDGPNEHDYLPARGRRPPFGDEDVIADLERRDHPAGRNLECLVIEDADRDHGYEAHSEEDRPGRARIPLGAMK